MCGAQGLAERIFEPEFAIPCGILLWVRKGSLRSLSDQRRFEEVVAKDTEMHVSNEFSFTSNAAFYLPLNAEQTPECEIAGLAHTIAFDMRGWLEQLQIVCHSRGLKFIRPSYFIHSTHAEKDAHEECGLQCGKRTLGILLKLPKPLRLGKKFVPKVSRVPIFGTIGKGAVTVLGQDSAVSI